MYIPQAKEDTHHSSVNDALKKIKPHIDELFAEDLPLYLIIAYRLHIRSALYQCEEMRAFVLQSLQKIHVLDYHQLAQVLNNFVKRYEVSLCIEYLPSIHSTVSAIV